MWPVLADECPVGVMIQVTETAEFHEKTLAMNQALMLGSLRQHELTEASEHLNAELREQIAGRKQGETALRASEARYRALFNSIDEGFCIIEKVEGDAAEPLDFRYLEANPAFETQSGGSGVVGKTIRQMFPGISEEWFFTYDTILRTGEPIRFERTLVPPGRELELYAFRVEDETYRRVAVIFKDITQRKQAEAGIASLAAIVDSSDDAIISKDLDGVIRSWNKGAERLFGYAAHEAIGQSITLLIPHDRLHEETEILARLKRGEHVDHFETIRVRKDGWPLEISLTISPIKNAKGQVIGASKIAHDISERKHFEEQRQANLASEQALRLEAEAANRSKDVFLATLSHEVRTPLNAILGWATILRDGNRTEADITEGMEVIERNCKAQAQLIEDVLDISRIVSGKLRLHIRPCELVEVINAAIDVVRPAADAKGIRLEKTLDPAASQASCDQSRLQQVVWNLLANAVKFAPKGSTVRVGLARERSDLRIQVSDEGQGISPEFLPYVFDRFRQADSSTRRKQGGLGLGLSIVKHIVELHGGTVAAHSAGEGRGAVFTVNLPIRAVRIDDGDGEAPSGSDDALAPDLTPVRLDGLRVLVVDDEADARRLLVRVLGEAGAIVTAAGSVVEALAALATAHPPQALVSDIAMPGQDGYDLIRQVRGLGHTVKDLPAVALTAFAHKDDRRRALLAGFQVHVSKPVDPHDLIAVVGSLSGRTG